MGPCPGTDSIFTLLCWMRVAGVPVVGDQEYLVILRGCKWNVDLLAIFTLPFGSPYIP